MEVVVLGYEIWGNLYFLENFLWYYHNNLSIKYNQRTNSRGKPMNTQITAIDFRYALSCIQVYNGKVLTGNFTSVGNNKTVTLQT